MLWGFVGKGCDEEVGVEGGWRCDEEAAQGVEVVWGFVW